MVSQLNDCSIMFISRRRISRNKVGSFVVLRSRVIESRISLEITHSCSAELIVFGMIFIKISFEREKETKSDEKQIFS